MDDIYKIILTNPKLFNITEIEKRSGIPRGVLMKVTNGQRKLPARYLPEINEVFQEVFKNVIIGSSLNDFEGYGNIKIKEFVVKLLNESQFNISDPIKRKVVAVSEILELLEKKGILFSDSEIKS